MGGLPSRAAVVDHLLFSEVEHGVHSPGHVAAPSILVHDLEGFVLVLPGVGQHDASRWPDCRLDGADEVPHMRRVVLVPRVDFPEGVDDHDDGLGFCHGVFQPVEAFLHDVEGIRESFGLRIGQMHVVGVREPINQAIRPKDPGRVDLEVSYGSVFVNWKSQHIRDLPAASNCGGYLQSQETLVALRFAIDIEEPGDGQNVLNHPGIWGTGKGQVLLGG